MVTVDFTTAELQAVVNLIEYSMKDIWPDSEPLVNVVFNKFKVNLDFNY